jgi:hypothetical protein
MNSMLLLFLPTPHSRFLVLIFLTTKRTTNECLLDAKENIYSTTPSTIFGGKELYRSTKNNPQALDQKHQNEKLEAESPLLERVNCSSLGRGASKSRMNDREK